MSRSSSATRTRPSPAPGLRRRPASRSRTSRRACGAATRRCRGARADRGHGLATLLLCPDERSAATLRDEGTAGRVEVVGDVMADATLRFAPIARSVSHRHTSPARTSSRPSTGRRRAPRAPAPNRRGPLADRDLVVLPAHPRTASVLVAHGIPLGANVDLCEPLGDLAFASAASQARVVATDSGGLQKEAYWYRVPCVTMCPSTEWVDTVVGWCDVLVDDDPHVIAEAVGAARFRPDAPPLDGEGHAAARVGERAPRYPGAQRSARAAGAARTSPRGSARGRAESVRIRRAWFVARPQPPRHRSSARHLRAPPVIASVQPG